MGPRSTAVLLFLASALTIGLLVGTTFPDFTWLIVPTVLLTVAIAWGVAQVGPERRWLLPALLVLGAAVAVYSTWTGTLNGLSDEPYTTPAYASLGWGLYTHPLNLTYVQYGTSHFESSFYVYLPLLTFLQVPGLDYRWVALGAWAGMVFLLRRDPFALTGLSVAWVPLLAANGQNDFVPLLAITGALVVRPERGGWVVEALSLGLKQPANVLVGLYHVVRGEYLAAVASVAITVAILGPFLYLNAGAVYCHVLVGAPNNTCTGRPWTFFVFKRNYWLYPTWAVVVFHRSVGGWVRKYAPAPLRRTPVA